MEMASAFTLNVRLDNIAIITIDVPGEKMNTLKAEFASQVRAIIKQIRENKELRGVVCWVCLVRVAAAASVHGLAPLHLPRRPTRPVSYYAFFK